MSLDKAIKSGKEKRKQYHDSRAFDHSCRNNGSCPFCVSNRTIQAKRAEDSAKARMDEIPQEPARDE